MQQLIQEKTKMSDQNEEYDQKENADNLSSSFTFKVRRQYFVLRDQEELCLAIQNKSQLQYLNLYLADKNILDSGLYIIAKGISCCKNLKNLEIYLMKNQISEIGTQNLGNFISQCPNLEQLLINLIDNQFGIKGSNLLEQEISKCVNLRSLVLEESNYYYGLGDAAQSDEETLIGLELYKLDKLQKLKWTLRWNKLKNDDIDILSRGILRIPNLQNLDLDLSGNNFQGEGYLTFFKNLENNQTLRILKINFRYNQLEDNQILQLNQALSKLYFISVLHLVIYNTSIFEKYSIIRRNLIKLKRLTHLSCTK